MSASGSTIGHIHIGVGAFHRCHQLDFVDDMLEARFGPWGVVGDQHARAAGGAEPGAAGLALYPQLREGARAETRVIGCLSERDRGQ